jgi:hypothetical protein
MAKRRAESHIWHFNSRPLKVGNRPNFRAFRWCATYCWKALDKGYNFATNLISIGGLETKLWASKVAGVPTLGISGLPLGSPETKCHLDAGPMANHKVYYKGEGGGFPQAWVVVSLVSSNLLVAHPRTKSVLTMHQPTCCLVLCRSMWMIKCLSIFLVPSRSSSMPLYPQSVVNQEACPNSLFFHYFTSNSHLSLSKSLGARQLPSPSIPTTLQKICHLLRGPFHNKIW